MKHISHFLVVVSCLAAVSALAETPAVPSKLERRAATRVAETTMPGVPGKGLVGDWQGSLPVAPGVALRLVIHVTADASGQLTASLDSLDQKIMGIPVTSVTRTNDGIRLDLAKLSATYEGQLSENGADIEGRWKQGPNDLPLVFRRKASAPALSSDQEPHKPYSYVERFVSFPGGSSGVTLAGTLTIPNGEGPFPGVVLVSGSGPQDRNETVMGHRPFLVLADYLTRHGIAVLRYDDRGVADSTGSYVVATHEDRAADARAAFTFLKGQLHIDPKHVGLCGHSEGGLEATIVAAEDPDVAFTVMLAAIAVPLDQLLLRQRQDFLHLTGLERIANPEGKNILKQVFSLLRAGEVTDQTRSEIRGLLHQIADFYPPAQREALGFSTSAVEQDLAIKTGPWFVKLLGYTPALTLKRVHCPVLALNGDKDIQVACQENLESIRSSLAAAGNTAATVEALPGLNHFFQHCATGLPSEYGLIQETMSDEVLKLIGNWIRERSQSPAAQSFAAIPPA